MNDVHDSPEAFRQGGSAITMSRATTGDTRMAGRNFLAFDLGAESGRAVLGTLENGRLTLQEKHRFANPTGRMNGHLHWNLLAQWEELKTGLKNVAGGVPLSGIGVDTWGVDYGLIGRV